MTTRKTIPFLYVLIGMLACFAVELPPYFIGENVTTREELADYTGIRASAHICGEWRRRAYICNHEQLSVNYSENVEFELRREQIILAPQTADFLYGPEGVPKPRYVKGSRPVLEAVVGEAIAGKTTQQEKALAIMRFCRDLKKRPDRAEGDTWYFGGTEEQLIEKGEDLCETLGRLFTALCEIAGIPARIIMHDIGGHITEEAYMDGHWGYIDPRFGIYFLRPDGKIASLWELMNEPRLADDQPEGVKAEVAGVYTWEQRADACRRKFFAPQEVNGFEYYSLADKDKYHYGTLTEDEVTAAGLYRVNGIYGALIAHIFNLPGYGRRRLDDCFWQAGADLKPIELSWRNDGFSIWYETKAPVAAEQLDKDNIAPFEGKGFASLVWGTGPGCTFTHRTKVGEVFGEDVSEEEWKTLMRPGDRNVRENIMGIVTQDFDPQELVANLAHRHGLKLYSRLEMNHGYPQSEKWMWLAFMGKFEKEHPEYLIPGTPNVDFKHKEVRDYKLSVLRELAASGVDGVVVDLAVYPPFFEQPEPEIMNEFMRDVRRMLDEEGTRQGKRLTLEASLPAQHCDSFGLDWRTWLREGLVDVLVPTSVPQRENRYEFDVRLEEFLRQRAIYGGKVYGSIDQSLRIFNHDEAPDGVRRHARGKGAPEICAQILKYMREGADGVVFNEAVNTRFVRNSAFYSGLGDPANVMFADKNYLADPFDALPVINPPKDAIRDDFHTMSMLSRIRVADDIAAAQAKGLSCEANLVLNCRRLNPGEMLVVYLNGSLVATLEGGSDGEEAVASGFGLPRGDTDLTVPDWWKRGMRTLPFPPEALWLGENIVRISYFTTDPKAQPSLQILWPEIQLRYH